MAFFRRSENESAVVQRAGRQPLAQGFCLTELPERRRFRFRRYQRSACAVKDSLAERGEFELPVPIVNSEMTGIKCTYESNKSATNAQNAGVLSADLQTLNDDRHHGTRHHGIRRRGIFHRGTHHEIRESVRRKIHPRDTRHSRSRTRDSRSLGNPALRRNIPPS